MPAKRCVGALRIPADISRLAGLALCLAPAACGEEPATPPKAKPSSRSPGASVPPIAPSASTVPAPRPRPTGHSAVGAANVLRDYYALIEARRYSEAFALREPNRIEVKDFAAHFEPIASQQVTVGIPSEPVEAGGSLYVEIPVQTFGTMKNGKPYASAGTVTLRRRNPDGPWRIYTK